MHYFATDLDLGAKNLPIDFVGLILYAGLIYTAFITSPWLYIFLALRGARGIIHNEMSLRYGKGKYDAERRRSYNYSSGFMVLTYIPAFFLDTRCRLWGAGGRYFVAIGIWGIAYAIALVVEARLDRRRSISGAESSGPSLPERSPSATRRNLLRVLVSGAAYALAIRAVTEAAKHIDDQ
jgi:hypothetical protein